VKLLHRLEPLFWLLFGAGGFVAALLLPALVFGVMIAAPMGWFSEYATSYHRMHALVANPVGQLLVVVIVTTVLWHSAHHLRHFFMDLGLSRLEAPISYVLYALALAGTLASLQAVAGL
jgi:fumarate reductase subunit D